MDASKEKAPIWFTSRGLQLPKLVQTIIDANNSIADYETFVKQKQMEIMNSTNPAPNAYNTWVRSVDDILIASAEKCCTC